MSDSRAASSHLPLTAVAFEILLTLADDDAHGYHIMQEVERRSGGVIVLHPGTLYRALARLLDEALITEVDGSAAAAPGQPRRNYRLTRVGRAVLEAEAARLEHQVREARARKILRKQER